LFKFVTYFFDPNDAATFIVIIY